MRQSMVWLTPLLVVGLLAGPAPASTIEVEPHPVTPSLQTIPLVDLAPLDAGPPTAEAPQLGRARDTAARTTSDPMSTMPFRLVAVTWDAEETPASGHEVHTWVRHRHSDEWSSWLEVPSSDGHGPDPGSGEGRAERVGTDPLLVPESDGVQVRIDMHGGQLPEGLRLDLVDPGSSAADGIETAPDDQSDYAAGSARLQATGTRGAPRPFIRSRAAWGADESIRRGPNRYGQIKAAFVHHTVNSNAYSKADVPGIIRSIYAYHVKSLGWDDVGYNFLVDRWGRIWEGRRGGAAMPVTGAHTYGHNDDAFAMSAIGTYTSTRPSAAMLAAYARLFAWKLDLHGVDPTASTSLDGTRVRTISGHRDTYATACPGNALYSRLPAIRQATQRRSSPVRIGSKARMATSLSDARVTRQETTRLRVRLVPRAAGAPVWLQRKATPRSDWSSIRRARFDDAGKARFQIREKRQGSPRYRVVSATQPQRVGTSVVLRVRR